MDRETHRLYLAQATHDVDQEWAAAERWHNHHLLQRSSTLPGLWALLGTQDWELLTAVEDPQVQKVILGLTALALKELHYRFLKDMDTSDNAPQEANPSFDEAYQQWREEMDEI